MATMEAIGGDANARRKGGGGGCPGPARKIAFPSPATIDLDDIREVAKERWFTPNELEVILLLRTTPPLQVSRTKPTSPPPSGTLILYDRSATSDYKVDGHKWKRKVNNAKKVREDHVKLRVGGKKRVAGCYVHGCDTPSFKRRAYHLLNYETGATEVMPRIAGVKKEFLKEGGEGNQDAPVSLILIHYLDAVEASRKRVIEAKIKSDVTSTGLNDRGSSNGHSPRNELSGAVKRKGGSNRKKQRLSPPIPNDDDDESSSGVDWTRRPTISPDPQVATTDTVAGSSAGSSIPSNGGSLPSNLAHNISAAPMPAAQMASGITSNQRVNNSNIDKNANFSGIINQLNNNVNTNNVQSNISGLINQLNSNMNKSNVQSTTNSNISGILNQLNSNVNNNNAQSITATSNISGIINQLNSNANNNNIQSIPANSNIIGIINQLNNNMNNNNAQNNIANNNIASLLNQLNNSNPSHQHQLQQLQNTALLLGQQQLQLQQNLALLPLLPQLVGSGVDVNAMGLQQVLTQMQAQAVGNVQQLNRQVQAQGLEFLLRQAASGQARAQQQMQQQQQQVQQQQQQQVQQQQQQPVGMQSAHQLLQQLQRQQQNSGLPPAANKIQLPPGTQGPSPMQVDYTGQIPPSLGSGQMNDSGKHQPHQQQQVYKGIQHEQEQKQQAVPNRHQDLGERQSLKRQRSLSRDKSHRRQSSKSSETWSDVSLPLRASRRHSEHFSREKASSSSSSSSSSPLASLKSSRSSRRTSHLNPRRGHSRRRSAAPSQGMEAAAAAAKACSDNNGPKDESLDVLWKMIHEDQELKLEGDAMSQMLGSGDDAMSLQGDGMNELWTKEEIDNIVTKNLSKTNKCDEYENGSRMTEDENQDYNSATKAATSNFQQDRQSFGHDYSASERGSLDSSAASRENNFLQNDNNHDKTTFARSASSNTGSRGMNSQDLAGTPNSQPMHQRALSIQSQLESVQRQQQELQRQQEMLKQQEEQHRRSMSQSLQQESHLRQERHNQHQRQQDMRQDNPWQSQQKGILSQTRQTDDDLRGHHNHQQQSPQEQYQRSKLSQFAQMEGADKAKGSLRVQHLQARDRQTYTNPNNEDGSYNQSMITPNTSNMPTTSSFKPQTSSNKQHFPPSMPLNKKKSDSTSNNFASGSQEVGGQSKKKQKDESLDILWKMINEEKKGRNSDDVDDGLSLCSAMGDIDDTMSLLPDLDQDGINELWDNGQIDTTAKNFSQFQKFAAAVDVAMEPHVNFHETKSTEAAKSHNYQAPSHQSQDQGRWLPNASGREQEKQEQNLWGNSTFESEPSSEFDAAFNQIMGNR